MSFVSKLVVFACTALSLGSVACVIGESRKETIYYDPRTSASTLTCETDDWSAPDLSGLTKCGGKKGSGHCFDKWKVSGIGGGGSDVGDYDDAACEGGEICVPDKILEAKGKPLQKCDFDGVPGVCMSRIAKRIDDNSKNGALSRGDCEGEDESCVPCTDPTRPKLDLTICDDIGVHENACKGGEGASGVSLCCLGLGVCTDKSGIPGGKADQLPKDSCEDEGQVCAPAALIDNAPEKCELPLGVKGVCLPFCFAQELQGAKAAVRSSCNALSFCLPCAIGKSQGMPGCE